MTEARPSGKIDSLRSEAASCQACPLWKDATQTVSGEGPPTAEIMLVAEQPGIGKTVKAARSWGRRVSYWTRRWLRRAWTASAVTTNAVKHCKFELRVKRRLHKRPNAGEIKICQRWLFEEIAATGPRLIDALGATAARSLAGQAIPVQANRGKTLDGANGLRIFMTIHPSALLRLRDEEEKRSAYASFVNDLRSIERLVGPPASQANPDVRKAA
jgi:uracil-DNA glycosylase